MTDIDEPRPFYLCDDYRVSCDGRIESRLYAGPKPATAAGAKPERWKPHRPCKCATSGYWVFSYRKGGRSLVAYVHVAVARAFLGAPSAPGLVVRHLDDDKDNFHLDNLAYGTHAENAQDRVRNCKSKGKHANPSSPVRIDPGLSRLSVPRLKPGGPPGPKRRGGKPTTAIRAADGSGQQMTPPRLPSTLHHANAAIARPRWPPGRHIDGRR